MRIVVLLPSSIDGRLERTLAPVLAESDLDVVAALIDGRARLRPHERILEELRRGRGGYVAVQVVQALVGRNRAAPSTTSGEWCAAHGVPSRVVETTLYEPDVLAWIRGFIPDVIVRLGFGILQQALLNLAPLGVLSYHHGDIRRYRGQPYGFWEVHDGAEACGVTVQVLAPGLDCGRIVREIQVPIAPHDSWSAVQHRVEQAGEPLLSEALVALQNGLVPLELAPDEFGRVRTIPNLRQWLRMQSRVVRRRMGLPGLGRPPT